MNDRGSGLSGLAHSESSGEVVGRYDSWVGDYEADVRSWGYTLPERLVARLGSLVESPSQSSVLDAGCGTGLVGRALREAGFDAALVGADVSQQSLRSANDEQIYTELVAASIRDGLAFGDATFDVIVCGGVLTYVPDTYAALREFLRVLCPDGVAVVSQRTDLWVERGCDDVMQQLRHDGAVVDVGEPEPYLPGLADYGDDIQVMLVTLRHAR